MSLLNASKIRILCDSNNLNQNATDAITGLAPDYTRGDTIAIEVLLVLGGVPIPRSTLSHITIAIQPIGHGSQEITYIHRVIPQASMFPLVGTSGELTAWESGGPGHGTVDIHALTGLLPSGQYRLKVKGFTASGTEATYLNCNMWVRNPSGVDSDDPAALVLSLAGSLSASIGAALSQVASAQTAATSAATSAASVNASATAALAVLESVASQEEAEAGGANNRMMTPLRTAQQIAASGAIVHRTGNESISGAKTFTGSITAEAITANNPITSAQPATDAAHVPNLSQVKDLLQRKFPLAADFPNVNGAAPAATMLDNPANGLLVLYGPGLATYQSKHVHKPITASGDWTATARILLNAPQSAAFVYGIALRSSTANLVATIGWKELNYFFIHRANATTGAQTTVAQASINCGSMLQWVRVKFIAATNTYEVYLSPDGQYWWRIGSYTNTALFGGSNLADSIGIGIHTNETSGRDVSVSVPFWDSNA